MSESAPAEVKLTIGVPGRIVSRTIPRGTTVGQALTDFGFEALSRDIRGWTRGDEKAARSMALDDPIDMDMTVLLLQPIVGRAPTEDVIVSLVRDRLGAHGVRDIWVQPFDDYDGEDSLRVTIVLDPETAKSLDPDTTLNLIVELQRRLEEAGDSRFPVIEYATRDEIEGLAVEA